MGSKSCLFSRAFVRITWNYPWEDNLGTEKYGTYMPSYYCLGRVNKVSFGILFNLKKKGIVGHYQLQQRNIWSVFEFWAWLYTSFLRQRPRPRTEAWTSFPRKNIFDFCSSKTWSPAQYCKSSVIPPPSPPHLAAIPQNIDEDKL